MAPKQPPGKGGSEESQGQYLLNRLTISFFIEPTVSRTLSEFSHGWIIDAKFY